MTKIANLVFNPFGENTYVIFDQTLECVIVDAGCYSTKEQQALVNFIENNNLKPVLAINTHGHIDHMCGVEFVKQRWGVPFAMNVLDKPLLDSVPSYGASMGFDIQDVPTVDIDLSTQSIIEFGESKIEIVQTPGHTPGHVSLYLSDIKTLLTGDTLFRESIGRTDLPGGDYSVLMNSIIKKIVPLGGDVVVFPGHGPKTEIAHEIMYNPFITEVLNGEVNANY